MKQKIAHLILHNIRSAQNVGSLFRTADAAGISKLYLTGYTPGPLDRFNRPVKEIAKTALGAEKTVSWEKVDFEEIVGELKSSGFYLVGIEQDRTALDYKEVKIKFPVAFVLGNEVEGLDAGARKACDVLAEIPMKGKKESLNVSVAGGVALFRMLDM